MKLGTRGRYAVMAMVDLAQSCREGAPVALSKIADRQEISLSYLEQLFNRLRKSGLVQSVRGTMGGYVLAKDPSHIYIADIVEATDKLFKATRCDSKSKNGCLKKGNAQCVVHHLWEEMSLQINGFLQSISLQDILNRNFPRSSLDLPLISLRKKV